MESASDAGVPLVSTYPYYSVEGKTNEYLIAFGAFEEEKTREGIDRFATLLKERAGFPV